MYKTQSLSRLGKWIVPKGSHEIITVLLTRIGNGWRATGGNKTATGGNKVLGTLHHASAGLKALRVFQHMSWLLPWMSSYVLELGRRSSSSQSSSRRRRWLQMLKTQLHLKRSSSIASCWHYFAFRFCSSPLKHWDNSFFRSTDSLCKSESALMCICFNFFLLPLQDWGGISLVKGDCKRTYFCLPSDFLSTLLRCSIPQQRALILFPFSCYRALFQATATAYPTSSSNWVKNEWKKGAVQICNLVWLETNGTLCTLGVYMSAAAADVPLLLQAARGTMLSFSSDNTYYRNKVPF